MNDRLEQKDAPLSVVTGAFGYSGRRIAERLLNNGERVRTLTNHPDKTALLYGRVEVAPLDFGSTEALAEKLRGATVLYNTYWVRFAYGVISHAKAVANTKTLIRAAEIAGVSRIVHVSITNPSLDSRLPYFRGKAEVEQAILSSSLSYAILRPAVLFGDEDILINNIAWFLRRFPLFAIPGDGTYQLQPIHVDDFAEMAFQAGHRRDNCIMDAVGPEAYTFGNLVTLIRNTIGSHARVLHLPATLVALTSQILSWIVDDVVLTRDEVSGLTANMLVSKNPPLGRTSLKHWLETNATAIGATYASELARHYRGTAAPGN